MEQQIHYLEDAQSFQVSWEEGRKLRRRYMPYVLRTVLRRRKKSVIDHFYDEKIHEKTILIRALGVSVRGNMQYVLNVLNSDDRFKGYKIYVRTSKETHETVKEYIRQNNWKRTIPLEKYYNKMLERCQYLITESFFPYNWIKKPEQILIDTWHGTPLKKLGIRKNGKKAHLQAIQQKNFLCTDYFLYPNKFTQKIMYESYGVVSMMKGKALMLGYPRTGGMLSVPKEDTEKVRKTLAPNGEKVYAYMPTFRGYLSDEETIQREKDLLTYIDEHLRDDQILYVNLHHHIGQALDCSVFKHIRTFPPLIDSYELLTATDALISDYSSVFYDYLILGKQIILYIEDYETYSKYQGLNADITTLPFDKARSKEELVEMLNRGKNYDDTQIRSELCAYDSPRNAEKLSQLFAGDESGLTLEEHPHNDMPKVLFYTECCREGKETELLSQFSAAVDKSKYDYRIGCDTKKTADHLGSAYPMLHDSDVITSEDVIKLSSIGAPLKQKCLKGRIGFDKAIEYLQHEYALIPIQYYGYTKFDLLAIYDTPNADMILSLSLADAKSKALFITDDILKMIDEGDAFMKDAIRFAGDHCNVCAVSSPENVAKAEQILSDKWKDKVSVINDVSAMQKLCGFAN
ncbi:MAG: CDP-glycerol glycerophosphotransferase family protein [Lachnospiraceae bacterium]|nr:CDP-glycerol glycerophosphotransferase family protein [Lachnospiraceae bacterium]